MADKLLRSFVILLILGTTACKQASVGLGSLEKLSGFSVDQLSVTVQNKANPGFTLSGKCTQQISNIEVSFDAGLTWLDISTVSALNISCATTGTFSASFNRDVTAYVNDAILASVGGFYIRGDGDFGFTASQLVAVKSHVFAYPIGLASSASHQATGTYKVKMNVRSAASPTISAAGSYTVKNLRVEVGQ